MMSGQIFWRHIDIILHPSMPSEMWLPLLVNVIGFYCLMGAVVIASLRNEIMSRERNTAWVREELLGSVK